ncbi:MAG: N-acetyltransferase [Candidatus Omnitrophica bacterium]|nr:N-acetyltransferase [Candidatus Omnitrophota bacterium]
MIRKARIQDAAEIHGLIGYWAAKKKMLERPMNHIYENIRDYWLYTERKKILGCCALHSVGWNELGEIKSLSVRPRAQRRGIATKLVRTALREADTLGMRQVFALTFVPDFFSRLGFREIPRSELPHKIWSDCIHCVFFPDCKETAVIATAGKSAHKK